MIFIGLLSSFAFACLIKAQCSVCSGYLEANALGDKILKTKSCLKVTTPLMKTIFWPPFWGIDKHAICLVW